MSSKETMVKPFLYSGMSLFKKNVRKGFLAVALIGTSVLGSTLWATIAMLPFLQERTPHSGFTTSMPFISARAGVPAELAWFFVQYPYLSTGAQIRSKNNHTFIVSDARRGREYVVKWGQSFRRVEIYFKGDKDRTTVHCFSPGRKRTVGIRGPRVVSDGAQTDPNLWMWQGPLWNSQHLKIYALADFWLNAPYKRFSCAGFVHEYLKDAGVRVPVQDAWDMARQPWTRVPVDEMEPGDIITIRAGSERHRRYWNHRITHVGVYLGNGKLIHASTPSFKARRSYIRVATLDQFRGRIDKILRPPDLL